jgi:predicted ferric reductase
VVLGPVALAAAAGVPPADAWGEAGTAAGSIALAAMAVQFLTSGRFETFAGRLGIDVTMAFHKRAARWTVVAVVLHPLLYVAPTMIEDPSRGFERIIGMLSAPSLSTGLVAWLAAILLVLLAVVRGRLPIAYETWRVSHGLLAILAMAGGLHHALTVGTYAAEPLVAAGWFAAALLVAGSTAILYGLRWWRLHRRAWRLVSNRRVGTALWELELAPESGTRSFPYRAGQYVWMTVAPRLFPLFDHPFSIASSPLRPGLRLVVKEVGDFTRGIGSIGHGTRIGIDGPHGNFIIEGRDADAILLVAGGAGIAPVLGLLRDLTARGDPRPIRLVYGAGGPDKIIAKQEIAQAGSVVDLRAQLISEAPAEGWTGPVGTIDRACLEEALRGLDRDHTLAMICGPDAMITAVTDTLLDLGLPMRNVVYERFDYGAGPASRIDRRRSRRFAAIGIALAAGVAAFALR